MKVQLTPITEHNAETLLMQPSRQREAFTWMVQRLTPSLYWRVRRMVVNHEDANDVLQNALIKAWTHMESYKGDSRFSTWLHRIVINEALDFLRRQRSMATMGEGEVDKLVDKLIADPHFDGGRAEALLQTAIAQLPDVQRTVFTLRYYDEMKYSEMSQVLNTSEGALKASYHIALRKVVDYVKSHEE